jgi:hypothetical protein
VSARKNTATEGREGKQIRRKNTATEGREGKQISRKNTATKRMERKVDTQSLSPRKIYVPHL